MANPVLEPSNHPFSGVSTRWRIVSGRVTVGKDEFWALSGPDLDFSWSDYTGISFGEDTWRITPVSKWLVTPIYKPWGTTPVRGLTNHGY